jgi:ABC-type multidrug transport system fused ATPase/permease subunit
MRKFTISIYLVILLVLVLAFFIVKDTFDIEKFSLILNIISATQIFVTFLIAYLVYDRFATSRKLLDKQNEIVIEYIEEIKKIRLFIYEWTGEIVYNERNIGITRDLHWIYQEKDRPVLFKSQFYSSENVKKLYELVNHPLFPVAIKKNVDIFSYTILTATFSDYKEGYTFVSFEKENDFDMKSWMLSGHSHDDCLTLNQLIKKIENLLITLEDWVNKESSIKIKLNF